ncbi:MAG: branched-chain-amino-acid transaminase [Gammaproteobacteria bacterium AqS3]|nr:branched-chain-amino-acid transaminase [Gammaproteobacteria bacterium AqS3]
MDGELVPWQDAKVHVLNHTMHYGLGVFEGVRAYREASGQTAIFRLSEHTERLFNSAHILGIEIPFTREQIIEAQRTSVRENRLEEAYVRPLVFMGAESLGLRVEELSVHVIVAAWEWPHYMSAESQETGIRMRTASITRHHVNISMCKAKAIANYTNSMLALREAISAGDDEALLLDNEGYATEGSGENIFLLKNDVLHTPELTSCLDGITRDSVLQFAREEGIEVIERRITRDEFYIADEVFLTGTAAEIVPVRSLDGRVISSGRRGPVTELMQQRYSAELRGTNEARHPEWRTPVA